MAKGDMHGKGGTCIVKGACRAGGSMCGRACITGGHAWQGHAWWGACIAG